MNIRVRSTYNVSQPSRNLRSYQIAIEPTDDAPHRWTGDRIVENDSDRRVAVFESLGAAASAIAEHVGSPVAILSDLIDGGYSVCALSQAQQALQPDRLGFVRHAHVATGQIHTGAGPA